MKRLRWQLIIIFLTGLVMGILLLSEQPAIQQLVPEPVSGGIYTEALIGSPQRLNPLLDTYNPVDRDVNYLLFNGLLKMDDRGVPQPDLAESWGISRDNQIYNLELRNGITWHDGTPFSTRDVLFTIELMREGGGVISPDISEFWESVEVEALSETTIQFQLPEPFAPFTDYLTFGILPSHILGNVSGEEMVDHPFNLQPVGTGPYRFESFIVNGGQISGLVLHAFSNYYSGRAYLDQINFLYFDTADEAIQAFREGTVQGISQIPPDLISEALKIEDLAVFSVTSPELAMVLLNHNNPAVSFFQEAPIRTALLHSINRQRIINTILNSQAVIAHSPILPGTWAYFSDIQPVDFNLEQAANILQREGYILNEDNNREKDGTLLSFDMLYPDTEHHLDIAEAIREDLLNLGVTISLIPVPYETLISEHLETRNFQAALVDINFSKTPDPDPYPFWDQAQATGGQNYTQWDNRTASEFIEEARITNDLNERARLYRNFQVIFREQSPALLLYYPIYNYGVDYQIQGISLGPLFDFSDRYRNITDWFMVTRRQAVTQPIEDPSTE